MGCLGFCLWSPAALNCLLAQLAAMLRNGMNFGESNGGGLVGLAHAWRAEALPTFSSALIKIAWQQQMLASPASRIHSHPEAMSGATTRFNSGMLALSGRGATPLAGRQQA